MSLFPLPAIIFLCCLMVLLIVLAVLYFILKRNQCCQMEGAGADEGEAQALIDGGEARAELKDVEASKETAGGGANTESGGNGGGGDAVDAAQPSGGTLVAEPMLGTPASDTLTVAPPRTDSHEPQGGDATLAAAAAAAESQLGFIESEEPEPLAIAGQVLVQFTYMPAANKINMTVIRAGDMPPVDRGGSDNVQVHLCVLPMRKQRFRTKSVPVSKGVFNETFQFIHMTQDIVEKGAIRLRVYGTQRFSKRLIGEVKMPLSKLDLTSPLADEQIWKTLSPKGLVDLAEPSYNLSDISSLASYGESTTKPEILINLHYQELTGRLHVEVIRAANLKPQHMIINPNTFMKIKCISGKGKKIGKSKTSIRHQASDPEYNETFVYPMSSVDLQEATMMFTVFSVGKRRKKKRTIIGWFSFGQNTSGTFETHHWKEMIQNPDCDVCHWQALQVAS